jgi:hypothetical protein
MKYVFDLDNTLCMTSGNNYEKAEPIVERIHYVNRLFHEGNTIVVYTARGMGSRHDNQIKAINKYYSFTEQQLQSWGLKYHTLILGKPSADFYIDDKGVESEDFFRANLRP